MAQDGCLIARQADGTQRWSTPLPSKPAARPVLTEGGVVVSLLDPRDLHCFDPTTGKPRWKAPGLLAPLLVVDNLLLARSVDEKVVALDSSTGERLWQLDPVGGVYGLAREGEHLVTVNSENHRTGEANVTVFDPVSRRLRWSHPAYTTSHALNSDSVFVGSGLDGVIKQLALATGEVVAEIPPEGRYPRPLLADERVLYYSRTRSEPYRHQLVAYDLKQERELWSADSDEAFTGLVPGDDGLLYARDRFHISAFTSEGRLVWKGFSGFQTRMSVEPDGTVFGLNQAGALTLFRTPTLAELAGSPEPSPQLFDFDDLVMVGDFEVEKQD